VAFVTRVESAVFPRSLLFIAMPQAASRFLPRPCYLAEDDEYLELGEPAPEAHPPPVAEGQGCEGVAGRLEATRADPPLRQEAIGVWEVALGVADHVVLEYDVHLRRGRGVRPDNGAIVAAIGRSFVAATPTSAVAAAGEGGEGGKSSYTCRLVSH
jgi:hypothetical protein